MPILPQTTRCNLQQGCPLLLYQFLSLGHYLNTHLAFCNEDINNLIAEFGTVRNEDLFSVELGGLYMNFIDLHPQWIWPLETIISTINNESLLILIIWEALHMHLCIQMTNRHLMSINWIYIELSISWASRCPRKETHLFIPSSALGYSLQKQWESDMRKQQDIFPITYSPINHSSLWNLAGGHWSLLGKC